MTRKWAPQTRYTLRRNTANIMKGLVLGPWNFAILTKNLVIRLNLSQNSKFFERKQHAVKKGIHFERTFQQHHIVYSYLSVTITTYDLDEILRPKPFHARYN